MRTRLRAAFAGLCRNTPAFRGKRRLVHWVDALVTDAADPASRFVVASVNGTALMEHDLRGDGLITYYFGELEREFIALAGSLYPGGAFIDVGSNAGLYAVCLAPQVKQRGARFLAIEPLPFNVRQLRRNLALNGLQDDVEILECAAGAQPGTVRVYSDPLGIHTNGFVHPSGQHEIELKTIDAIVRDAGLDRVGFIKMDIEGYEPMALQGARETLARDHPVLFAEFNRERMAINGFEMAPSWELLASLGYRAFEVVHGALRPLPQPGAAENIFFVA